MRKIISISSVSLLLLAPFASPQGIKTPVSPRGPSVAAGSQGAQGRAMIGLPPGDGAGALEDGAEGQVFEPAIGAGYVVKVGLGGVHAR